ncbi:uncharacterized protein EDB93DRAFT_1250194 [Suillus bovinus]|uniref:uncharacterized protein n=1 Tax=Suillus bovinus TaxID=48563 RepID=UPI001B861294|nr:uncharacterized protein EDB93DRAFT_1250194 [Suillus bovinus]KAG2148760.1 hypothetical protein EDB93DRAFT_1250194 [Suillus bovinus]
MPTKTRAEAYRDMMSRRKMARIMRAQILNDRLKTSQRDGPFRGTRSGRHAIRIDYQEEQIMVEVPDVPANAEPNDVRQVLKAEGLKPDIGTPFNTESIDHNLGAVLKIESKISTSIKIEQFEPDLGIEIKTEDIKPDLGITIKVEPVEPYLGYPSR